jgi:hypothetical protein
VALRLGEEAAGSHELEQKMPEQTPTLAGVDEVSFHFSQCMVLLEMRRTVSKRRRTAWHTPYAVRTDV